MPARHGLKTITVAAITMAGLGLAALGAVHGAHASHTDDAFVRQVNSLDIGFTSQQAVVDDAHDVCRSLRNGQTAAAIGHDILGRTHLRRDQATRFVAAAINSYCQQYRAQLSA